MKVCRSRGLIYLVLALLFVVGLTACSSGGNGGDGGTSDGSSPYYIKITSFTYPTQALNPGDQFTVSWKVSYMLATSYYTVEAKPEGWPAQGFLYKVCGYGQQSPDCPGTSGSVQCTYNYYNGQPGIACGSLGIYVPAGSWEAEFSACGYDGDHNAICDTKTFQITLNP